MHTIAECLSTAYYEKNVPALLLYAAFALLSGSAVGTFMGLMAVTIII